MDKKKILIVEDDEGILGFSYRGFGFHPSHDDYGESIEETKQKFDKLFPKGPDIARTYLETKNYILQNNYNIILLDHRMPLCDSSKIDNFEYTLIPLIKEKNPSTIIMGTSSCNDRELLHTVKPDYKLPKISDFDLSDDYKLCDRFFKILDDLREKRLF